jgi:hypothetical protein
MLSFPKRVSSRLLLLLDWSRLSHRLFIWPFADSLVLVDPIRSKLSPTTSTGHSVNVPAFVNLKSWVASSAYDLVFDRIAQAGSSAAHTSFSRPPSAA